MSKSNDTISRQAVIDVLHGYFDGMLETDTWSPCDVFGLIENLPSAQADSKELSPTHKALDTISRQAAVDRINKQREHLQPEIYPQDKIGDAAYRICAEFIERLPSEQADLDEVYAHAETEAEARFHAERKKGKWIEHIDDLFPVESTIECSECHHEQPLTIDDNYCPNCGARMEDSEE